MTFAPVLICTLNRYEHFKRCVESLSNCYNAKYTDLYISVDFPLYNHQVAGNELIKNYLPSISGFNSVNIIIRDRNFGVHDNWTNMIDFVFQKNDKLIISEDDNYFSISFLDYINKGLNLFENSNEIFSISGYQFPINFPEKLNNDIYLWCGFAAWGVGVWKDKWYKMNSSFNTLNNSLMYAQDFFRNFYNVYKFNKVANHFIPTLLHCLNSHLFLGDAFYSLYMYRNNLYTVFPPISLVRNTGHDGSGVNSRFDKKNTYVNQKILVDKFDWKFNPTQNIIINELIYKHFRNSFFGKIKLLLKLIVYYLSNMLKSKKNHNE